MHQQWETVINSLLTVELEPGCLVCTANAFSSELHVLVLEKRLFNMYDENRDGVISFRELMVVMYVMANGTPEENLRQIFRV